MRTLLCLALLAAACDPARRPDESVRAQPLPPAEGYRPLVGTVDAFRARCTADRDAGMAKITELKAKKRGAVETLQLLDEATTLLNDAGGRVVVADNSHPEEAMRKAGQECQQVIDKAGDGDLARPPGVRRDRGDRPLRARRGDATLRPQHAARFPPRGCRQGRGDADEDQGAQRRADQDQHRVRPEHPRRRALDPGDAGAAGGLAGRLREGPRRREDHHQLSRLRALHDLREGQRGAREVFGASIGSGRIRRTWRCSSAWSKGATSGEAAGLSDVRGLRDGDADDRPAPRQRSSSPGLPRRASRG